MLSRFLPTSTVPSHKAAARFGSRRLSLLAAPRKWGKKGDSQMSYLNSVTLVGFIGADPEQRQAKGNGLKFTVFRLATQADYSLGLQTFCT
jgi:hypothetical protein